MAESKHESGERATKLVADRSRLEKKHGVMDHQKRSTQTMLAEGEPRFSKT